MTALEMNAGIRAKWVAALRSGDFEQGYEYLRKSDSYCCLGVLCAIAVAEGLPVNVTPPDEDDDEVRFWLYGERFDYLPEPVREWAGLREPDPEIPGTDASLTMLNDIRELSFAQIADAIEGTGQEGTP